MTKEEAIDLIWEYQQLHHTLEKADCIFILGSHDIRVAEYAATLYKQGYAPLMLISGSNLGNLTKNWPKTEAETFADRAEALGVPRKAMILEKNASNTGENVLFSRKLLEEKGLHPQKFILVQKPYMERRSFATFKKQWPGKEAIVTSPPISLRDYPYQNITREVTIRLMLADFRKIKEYPSLGYQIPQEIPPEVEAAYELLTQ